MRTKAVASLRSQRRIRNNTKTMLNKTTELFENLGGEFILADGSIGPNGGGTDFIFSPKTTSTTVPEPATMLLLGSGLLGLAGFRKKIFKK